MPTHYAVNPQTGERLMLMGDKWVPATSASTGSPMGAPKLTEGQAKDGFNAKRLQGAEGVISGLESKGYDAGLAKLAIGAPVGHVRNYNSAKDEWVDSLLRLTTGAAMTPFEAEHADTTYFPQLGDNPEVRKQKATMRARAEQAAIMRAGPGAAKSGPGGDDGPKVPEAARQTYRKMFSGGRIDLKAPHGSRSNPYSPVNEDVMNRLPKGSWVVTPDGHLGVIE